MEEKPEELNAGSGWNYFNYFTEVEEHFRRARGTGLFLMSPLDWALVESWKNAGIPLEAVLRGIDTAFEKRNARKSARQRSVNSVAYCAQAVQEEADAMAGGSAVASRNEATAPFTPPELQTFLEANAAKLDSVPGCAAQADSLRVLAAEAEAHMADLEALEQRLTAIEEKVCAVLRARIAEEELLRHRQELESTLRQYRSKMSAAQLAMLERQYLDKRMMEAAGVPRLSLFYMN